MLKNSKKNLFAAINLILITNLSINAYATNTNVNKRNNQNGIKKLNSNNNKVSSASFDYERAIETDNGPYIYSYSNTRSLNLPQNSADSCHLNIECKGKTIFCRINAKKE